MSLDQLDSIVEEFHALPENAVVFLMSNDETHATEAWRYLVAENVVNVYILEGGLNGWLDTFGEEDFKTEAVQSPTGDDQLRYQFVMAYADHHPASAPHADRFTLEYEPHVCCRSSAGRRAAGAGKRFPLRSCKSFRSVIIGCFVGA